MFKDIKNYMKTKDVFLHDKYYPLLTFLLSSGLLLLIFSYSQLLSNGRFIIMRSDLFDQYVPFIEMFIRDIKEGANLSYSWQVGLGSSTSLVYAYYTLSPFNLVFLLRDFVSIPTLVVFIIVAKLGLSAALFQLCAGRLLGREHFETVICGVCYSMCGFAVTYHFNIIWLDAVYMLPVIIMLIVKLVNENKWMLLALSYAYLFTVHFYTGYIVGCFSAAIFAACLIFKYQRGKAKLLIAGILRYGAAVLFGIGMSAVIWLPAGLYLLDNVTESQSLFPEIKCMLIDIVNGMFMGQMEGLEGAYPFVYSGVFSLLLIPGYFGNHKVSRREKVSVSIGLLLLVSSMLTEPLNVLLHGFDAPNWFGYRYTFCFSFLCIMIACRQFILLEQLKKKTARYLIAGYAVFYALMECYHVIQKREQPNTYSKLLLNVSFLIFWYILLISKNRIEKKRYLFFATFIMLFELGINSCILINQLDHKEYSRDSYQKWIEEEENTIKTLKSEDQSFYRTIYNNDLCINDSALFDFKGISVFSSGINQKIISELRNLGAVSEGLSYYPSGMTPFVRMLLNIKYSVNGNNYMEIVADGSNYYKDPQIEELDEVLSLGFMVNKNIKDYASDPMNPFENQNELAQKMTGNDKNQMFIKADYKQQAINVQVDATSERTYFEQSTGDVRKGEIDYLVDAYKDMEVYGCFRMEDDTEAFKNITVSTPRSLENNDLQTTQTSLRTKAVIKMGRGNEAEPYVLSIILEEKDEEQQEELIQGYYDKAHFYYLDTENLQHVYQTLEKNQLHISEYRNGYVKGVIEAPKDKTILFTSIPYDRGWQLYVDGIRRKEIGLLNDSFVGAELEEGIHEVELKFETYGRKEGIAITAATIVIFACQGLLVYIKAICHK